VRPMEDHDVAADSEFYDEVVDEDQRIDKS